MYTPAGESEPVGRSVSSSAGKRAVASVGECLVTSGEVASACDEGSVEDGTGVDGAEPKYDRADDQRPHEPVLAGAGAGETVDVLLVGMAKPSPVPSDALRYVAAPVGSGGGRLTAAGALAFLGDGPGKDAGV